MSLSEHATEATSVKTNSQSEHDRGRAHLPTSVLWIDERSPGQPHEVPRVVPPDYLLPVSDEGRDPGAPVNENGKLEPATKSFQDELALVWRHETDQAVSEAAYQLLKKLGSEQPQTQALRADSSGDQLVELLLLAGTLDAEARDVDATLKVVTSLGSTQAWRVLYQWASKRRKEGMLGHHFAHEALLVLKADPDYSWLSEAVPELDVPQAEQRARVRMLRWLKDNPRPPDGRAKTTDLSTLKGLLSDPGFWKKHEDVVGRQLKLLDAMGECTYLAELEEQYGSDYQRLFKPLDRALETVSEHRGHLRDAVPVAQLFTESDDDARRRRIRLSKWPAMWLLDADIVHPRKEEEEWRRLRAEVVQRVRSQVDVVQEVEPISMSGGERLEFLARRTNRIVDWRGVQAQVRTGPMLLVTGRLGAAVRLRRPFIRLKQVILTDIALKTPSWSAWMDALIVHGVRQGAERIPIKRLFSTLFDVIRNLRGTGGRDVQATISDLVARAIPGAPFSLRCVGVAHTSGVSAKFIDYERSASTGRLSSIQTDHASDPAQGNLEGSSTTESDSHADVVDGRETLLRRGERDHRLIGVARRWRREAARTERRRTFRAGLHLSTGGEMGTVGTSGMIIPLPGVEGGVPRTLSLPFMKVPLGVWSTQGLNEFTLDLGEPITFAAGEITPSLNVSKHGDLVTSLEDFRGALVGDAHLQDTKGRDWSRGHSRVAAWDHWMALFLQRDLLRDTTSTDLNTPTLPLARNECRNYAKAMKDSSWSEEDRKLAERELARWEGIKESLEHEEGRLTEALEAHKIVLKRYRELTRQFNTLHCDAIKAGLPKIAEDHTAASISAQQMLHYVDSWLRFFTTQQTPGGQILGPKVALDLSGSTLELGFTGVEVDDTRETGAESESALLRQTKVGAGSVKLSLEGLQDEQPKLSKLVVSAEADSVSWSGGMLWDTPGFSVQSTGEISLTGIRLERTEGTEDDPKHKLTATSLTGNGVRVRYGDYEYRLGYGRAMTSSDGTNTLPGVQVHDVDLDDWSWTQVDLNNLTSEDIVANFGAAGVFSMALFSAPNLKYVAAKGGEIMLGEQAITPDNIEESILQMRGVKYVSAGQEYNLLELSGPVFMSMNLGTGEFRLPQARLDMFVLGGLSYTSPTDSLVLSTSKVVFDKGATLALSGSLGFASVPFALNIDSLSADTATLSGLKYSAVHGGRHLYIKMSPKDAVRVSNVKVVNLQYSDGNMSWGEIGFDMPDQPGDAIDQPGDAIVQPGAAIEVPQILAGIQGDSSPLAKASFTASYFTSTLTREGVLSANLEGLDGDVHLGKDPGLKLGTEDMDLAYSSEGDQYSADGQTIRLILSAHRIAIKKNAKWTSSSEGLAVEFTGYPVAKGVFANVSINTKMEKKALDGGQDEVNLPRRTVGVASLEINSIEGDGIRLDVNALPEGDSTKRQSLASVELGAYKLGPVVAEDVFVDGRDQLYGEIEAESVALSFSTLGSAWEPLQAESERLLHDLSYKLSAKKLKIGGYKTEDGHQTVFKSGDPIEMTLHTLRLSSRHGHELMIYSDSFAPNNIVVKGLSIGSREWGDELNKQTGTEVEFDSMEFKDGFTGALYWASVDPRPDAESLTCEELAKRQNDLKTELKNLERLQGIIPPKIAGTFKAGIDNDEVAWTFADDLGEIGKSGADGLGDLAKDGADPYGILPDYSDVIAKKVRDPVIEGAATATTVAVTRGLEEVTFVIKDSVVTGSDSTRMNFAVIAPAQRKRPNGIIDLVEILREILEERSRTTSEQIAAIDASSPICLNSVDAAAATVKVEQTSKLTTQELPGSVEFVEAALDIAPSNHPGVRLDGSWTKLSTEGGSVTIKNNDSSTPTDYPHTGAVLLEESSYYSQALVAGGKFKMDERSLQEVWIGGVVETMFGFRKVDLSVDIDAFRPGGTKTIDRDMLSNPVKFRINKGSSVEGFYRSEYRNRGEFDLSLGNR